MKNADMPAMPPSDEVWHEWIDPKDTRKGSIYCLGLTKREMFSMADMQGITAAVSDSDLWPGCAPDPIKAIADSAVKHADALLKALEES